MNVVVGQQDLILEQLSKSNERWDSKAKSVYAELNSLKQSFETFKCELLKQVNEKVDILVKQVSSLNASANVQPKQNHQNPSMKVTRRRKSSSLEIRSAEILTFLSSRMLWI